MGRGGAEVEHQAGMMAWHAATLGANAMKLPRRTLLRASRRRGDMDARNAGAAAGDARDRGPRCFTGA